MVARGLFLILVVTGAFGRCLSGEGGEEGPWKVIRSSEHEWTVTYRQSLHQRGAVTIDGTAHLLFGPPFHPGSSGEGMPGLPVETISLGIPSGAAVSAQLEEAEYLTETGRSIAPVPTLVAHADGTTAYEYRKNRDAYARPGFLPADPVQVDDPYELRGQRIVTLRIAPLQFEPSAGRLRALRSARLRVRFSGPPPREHAGPGDPYYEGVFRGLIANYDEARRWRTSTLQKVAVDSTRLWFSTGRPYAKVSISHDGWYRVRKSALQPILGAGLSLDAVGLQCRGRSLPVYVRADSAIEFYGERLRGDSTFINDITDTNAYWLSTALPQPFHFTRTQNPGPGADTATRAMVVEHFEENRAMYVGTTEEEVISNSPIPGRGWVWEFLYPGSTVRRAFTLDTVDRSGTATLAVRLFSTTLHYSSPDHRARFWVNDSLVGEIAFEARKEAVFRAAIPPSILRSGSNTLTITSIPTASFPNQFYLDWFEIRRERPLLAVDDQLRFTADPAPGGVRTFMASGFRSAAVEVFDLTTGRTIAGSEVMPDGDGLFRCLFTDTLSDNRSYLLVTPSAAGEPDDVRQRVFADHRANTRGADYIVITHRLFAPFASELALHREKTNGVRSSVVDVEDLYDEFRYGVKDPAAMKEFLRCAASLWPLPHPAAVLLLGDACFDPKRYDSTTVKSDLVPVYGHPAGDNWFVCFDEAHPFLPSLFVGRLPVENVAQASAVVTKAKLYDGYAPSRWNKRFLFITGGNSESEQATFDQLSSQVASQRVTRPPVGGEVLRIGKKTSTVIDGDSRQSIAALVNDGLLYINFLGHSGGRIWNVDVGDPADFTNTAGQWPFVTSVSCNVGAFPSAFQNCLAEDFVFPDRRGAIAVWGSSSLGYAFFGTTMVDNLLALVSSDTVRELGALTTAARIRLWQQFGTSSVSIAHINLTPLIGDPLTRLALPIRPDLAVGPADLAAEREVTTAADTALGFRLALHNYGLVPAESLAVEVTDTYGSAQPSALVSRRIAPIPMSDTIRFALSPYNRPGTHRLHVALDPAGRIAEVTRANNSVAVETYVYATSTRVVRPFDNAVVPPGPTKLVVTAPRSGTQREWSARFELDTLPSFDSPGKIFSGSVAAGVASASWITPALPGGTAYFWRARFDAGGTEGSWSTSSFSTSVEHIPPPFSRWRQASGGQFQRDVRTNVQWSDTGVVLGFPAPLRLYARSLGGRSTTDGDQFSALRINDQTTLGYWWAMSYGIMAARVDPVTGLYELRAFELAYRDGDADSLAAFVEGTPGGRYLMFSVIIDGVSRASERFYRAIESLGSTRIRELKPGDAWTLIARKGAGSVPGLPSEHVSTTALVVDSVEVPARFGSGTLEGLPLVRTRQWGTFGWEGGGATFRVALAARRRTGGDDTLRVSDMPAGQTDLRSLDPGGVVDSYLDVRPTASMSTTDPLKSPVLKSWWIDLVPAAELVVGDVSLQWQSSPSGDASLSVELLNIGATASDSARCTVAVSDGGPWSPALTVDLPPIPVDSATTVRTSLPLSVLPSRGLLRVSVTPRPGGVDLIDENNVVELPLARANPLKGRIQVLANDAEVVDGDYIDSSPRLQLRVPRRDGVKHRTLRGIVDGAVAGEMQVYPDTVAQGNLADELVIAPGLGRGVHEIGTWVMDEYVLGIPDTSSHILTVRVTDEFRILNLFNYPNPFTTRTEFTFSLSGSLPPERGKITIYTIAGRRIRQLELNDPRIGFNRIEWDGRDEEGDDIANGTYLYRLEVRSGESTQAAGGKIVRMR